VATESSGVCIWFTGRSGGGKSTITRALVPRLEGMGYSVSVLDVVPLLRKRWWERTSEEKLLRKAYVASHIVHHGGVAIAVTVSARSSVREEARAMIGPDRFVEVLVAPPPEVAQQRKAARGRRPRPMKIMRRLIRRLLAVAELRGGEETPVRPPDLEIDSSLEPADDAARRIVAHVVARGIVPRAATAPQRTS
jgi:adenylylsulfate kinase-like enzyme